MWRCVAAAQARANAPPQAALTRPSPGATPPASPACAQVAELVDAQVSGTCGREAVEVRVFSWAPRARPASGCAARQATCLSTTTRMPRGGAALSPWRGRDSTPYSESERTRNRRSGGDGRTPAVAARPLEQRSHERRKALVALPAKPGRPRRGGSRRPPPPSAPLHKAGAGARGAARVPALRAEPSDQPRNGDGRGREDRDRQASTPRSPVPEPRRPDSHPGRLPDRHPDRLPGR